MYLMLHHSCPTWVLKQEAAMHLKNLQKCAILEAAKLIDVDILVHMLERVQLEAGKLNTTTSEQR